MGHAQNLIPNGLVAGLFPTPDDSGATIFLDRMLSLWTLSDRTVIRVTTVAVSP